MEKTLVVTFTTSYHPFIGGAEIAIREVAQRNRGKFDFVIIASRSRKNLPKEDIFPEGKLIRVGPGTKFDKLLLPFLGAAKCLSVLTGKKSGVILWGMDISQGSLAGALVSFLTGIPFVISIQYGESEQRIARGRLGIINAAFRFMLSQTSFVAAESHFLLGVARQYGYRGEAEVISNGVDAEKFRGAGRKELGTGTKTVITTSRLVYKNSVDILLKAFAEVKKSVPGTKLLVAGDGPLREELESLAGELALGDDVEFLGSVPHDDIPALLQRADVFVRASRSEGMGNSFIESLAAGLPIIGTPVGGILDIIEDGKTGLFCRPEDPHDLAQKIIKLLQDPELAGRIVRDGQEMVRERFSWDKISAVYGDMMGRIARRRLRIVIATPIFPPQIGGPAIYSEALNREFIKLGASSKIVSFGAFLRFPPVIRHFLYTFKLLISSFHADIIFSLDAFSVGFPAALVAILMDKPYVIRQEGDFLWEKFVEKNRAEVSLGKFYSFKRKLSSKEKIIVAITRWVLKNSAAAAVSSEWRKAQVEKYFCVPAEKLPVIKNVWPRPGHDAAAAGERKKIILWDGRMIYLKNLYRLIDAFARIRQEGYELHLIGTGSERSGLESYISKKAIPGVKFFSPMAHDRLLEKFREAAFYVLPSFSEVGPNVVSDCFYTKTPFILTKECGYAEYLKDICPLIDPFDKHDIASKMKIMMDDSQRKSYRDKLASAGLYREWGEAATEWLMLFRSKL